MNEIDQPPRAGVLRTPESRFNDIADFPWPPDYLMVEPGLRMAYYDAGPRDARGNAVAAARRTDVGLSVSQDDPAVRRRRIPGDRAGPDRLRALRQAGRSMAYTYSAHVAWVTRLVEHLDLHVTFFGQDWGGLIGGASWPRTNRASRGWCFRTPACRYRSGHSRA